MGTGRLKFIIGGAFILAAVGYLIYASMKTNAEFFMTVDEVQAQSQEIVGRNLRISGAVVGSTIQYDPQTLSLSFEIANVPGDNAEIEAQGGLAAVLHAAVVDPTRTRITVVYQGARTCCGTRPRPSSPAISAKTASFTPTNSCSNARPSTNRPCRSRWKGIRDSVGTGPVPVLVKEISCWLSSVLAFWC
jgi:cytochrome c-type biogenesis protein CcmE